MLPGEDIRAVRESLKAVTLRPLTTTVLHIRIAVMGGVV